MSDLSAFILAAGLGSRLRPLTEHLPKPLVPVLNEPILGWTIEAVRQAGINQIVVNAHSHPDMIEIALEQYASDLEVRLSVEEGQPRGTAGALALAIKRLGDFTGPVLVCAGDILHDVDLTRLVDAHLSSGAAATLVGIPTEDCADLIIEDSWVVDLVDRRLDSRPGWTYAAMGIFSLEALQLVPDGDSGLFESILQPSIADGAAIAAIEHEGYWMDVANPQRYLRANLDALAGHVTRYRPGKTLGKEHSDSWIDTGAEIGNGSTVRHCVIGPNVTIDDSARLNRCVVWPNSRVASEQSDAIILPSGIVRT